MFPTSRYNSVLRRAADDPALVISLLSVVATQKSLLRYGKIDEFALKLQHQAIQLHAQACLKNDPNDGRIMTALAIMSNHMHADNPTQMLPHMKAIASFVQQRGGIHYLGMDGIVADNIILADHMIAVIYNTKPNYPLITPSLLPEERRVTFSRHMGKAFSILHETKKISAKLYNVARDISLLTDIYDRATRQKHHEQETTYFPYLATAVECQLAELNALHHDTSSIEDMLTLAFLLINHTIFRNYGSISPIVPIIEARFWRCFEVFRQDRLPDNPESEFLFIWLAFTGIITQARCKCRFVKTAVSVLLEISKWKEQQSIQTFEQIRTNVLDRYLWSRTVLQHVYEPIWQEVLDLERTNLCVASESVSTPVL